MRSERKITKPYARLEFLAKCRLILYSCQNLTFQTIDTVKSTFNQPIGFIVPIKSVFLIMNFFIHFYCESKH